MNGTALRREGAVEMSNASEIAERLVAHVGSYGSCVVAFSGGVDSAVVAKAACLALGDRSVAATGIGPAVSSEELAVARRVALYIGIRHVELPTSEIERPDYVENAPDRCFHCKTELYGVLERFAKSNHKSVIANGTVLDDLGDYRPGLQAADNAEVRSPLVECGLHKDEVRDVACYWNLEVWDKPAAPCLASRIAYGQAVTPDRLRRIEAAEQLLHRMGIRDCRVRYHEGDLARVEVPLESIAALAEHPAREELTKELINLGFRYVTLDLAGLRSGSLNLGLPVVR